MDGERPEAPPSRVVIERVAPELDAGRFPIKRCVGERVRVAADVHADGHDLLAAVLLHRSESGAAWTETPMKPLGNDALRPGRSGEALRRIRELLEEVARGPFTVRDLDLVRFERRLLEARLGEDPAALASALAQRLFRTPGPPPEQLTLDQLNDTARRLLARGAPVALVTRAPDH